jgi:hypothetical protein
VRDAPPFQSLYELVSFLLDQHFAGEQSHLAGRNTGILTDEEQDRLQDLILTGEPLPVADAITALLKRGIAPLAISDAVNIAYATFVVTGEPLPSFRAEYARSFDYANVVNFCLRNTKTSQQVTAIYLSAWFVTETVGKASVSTPAPANETANPSSPSTAAEDIATADLLSELEVAISSHRPMHAVALVREWNRRYDPAEPGARDDLIYVLANCAAKHQGEPHVVHNAAAVIEEYQLNSASQKRKDVLLEFWAHVLACHKRRPASPVGYGKRRRYFGMGIAGQA